MTKEEMDRLPKTIERYRKDPEFHAVIDLLCQAITRGVFTFGALRDAMAVVELFDKRRSGNIKEHLKEE